MVLRLFGTDEAEIVVHHAGMRGPFLQVLRPPADPGQQSAGFIDGRGRARRRFETHAGRLFAVLGARLASNRVADLRACHQIALVARVDEDLRDQPGAVGQLDRGDLRAAFDYRLHASAVAHLDAGFPQQVEVDLSATWDSKK